MEERGAGRSRFELLIPRNWCFSPCPLMQKARWGVSCPAADWISEYYVHYFAFSYEQPRWVDISFAGDLRHLVPD